MSWDGFFLPHTVKVRDRLGGGGMGARYADSRDALAEVRDERRLVRDKDGAEVVSSSQVTVPLNPPVPVGSLVTVWPGQPSAREAEVLAVGRDDNSDDVDLDSFQILYLK